VPVPKTKPELRSDSDGLDEPDLELGRLLFGLVQSLRKHMLDVVADLGLTPAQAAALRNLYQPRSQRDLANRLELDASSVTDIADQLEARGLIERQVDPDDRRVRLLRLTGEGQTLRREFFTRMIHDAPPLRDLSDADRDALQSLLAKTVEPQDFLTVPTFRAKAR
jgi:DNA-binding MarR family transcriptional regulator